MYKFQVTSKETVTMSSYTLNFLAQGLSTSNNDQQTYARIMYDTMTENRIDAADYQFVVDELLTMMDSFTHDLQENMNNGEYEDAQKMVAQLTNISTALTELRAIPMYDAEANND